ncbi:hypothetical protein ACFV9C_16970 [Kribbella sp. NPDC059898]|uniref:hypothetical protein n=1 Tax=Kribbella sp. NPDC059898 TaxID=3346995 RepID=UPI00364E8811
MLEPADEVVRSAAALRLFLVGSLAPDEAQTVDQTERRLAVLEAQIEEAGPEWQSDPLAFGRLAAERGLWMLPALRDWATWGLEQLDAQVKDATK